MILCSLIMPQAAPCPLPQNDKHMVEVRGTITAHGYSDKEISTLVRLKHMVRLKQAHGETKAHEPAFSMILIKPAACE